MNEHAPYNNICTPFKIGHMIFSDVFTAVWLSVIGIDNDVCAVSKARIETPAINPFADLCSF